MTYRHLQKRLREARRMEDTLALASQIWLAGLGALARAQQEGSEFFDQLVECGEVMEAVEDDGLRELKQLARRVLAGSSQDRPDAPTPEDIQSLAEVIQSLNLDLRLRELDMG
jgi:polyhydroxyalkanoate synthesis regulator phasin